MVYRQHNHSLSTRWHISFHSVQSIFITTLHYYFSHIKLSTAILKFTGTIDNLTATGQVKLNGMEWSARSTSGNTLEVGTKVRVDKIEGVKVFVSPAEVPATV